jgi:hypothetical protein
VQGDTCQSIGRKWGLPAEVILRYNSFLECNDICEFHSCSRQIMTPQGVQVPSYIDRSRSNLIHDTDVHSGTYTPICIPFRRPFHDLSICGARYWSLQGDTCNSIASKWSTSYDVILNANKFLNCNDICTCISTSFHCPDMESLSHLQENRVVFYFCY